MYIISTVFKTIYKKHTVVYPARYIESKDAEAVMRF